MMTDDPLRRIADALDRLAPPAAGAVDPLQGAAFTWRAPALVPVRRFAPLPIDLLIGIDRQKASFVDNLSRFAHRAAAHDVLLWGARGMGKSALVASAVASVRRAHPALALVEAAPGDDLPTLFAMLAPIERPFLLFLDDFGVDRATDARQLRSLLEGGIEARPDNVRLAVTTNRRHIVARGIDGGAPDAAQPRGDLDDQLALADRFGISLGFHALDQDGYLAIVDAYAAHVGITVDHAAALGWAALRGARSGRVARQFIVDAAGRAGRFVSL